MAVVRPASARDEGTPGRRYVSAALFGLVLLAFLLPILTIEGRTAVGFSERLTLSAYELSVDPEAVFSGPRLRDGGVGIVSSLLLSVVLLGLLGLLLSLSRWRFNRSAAVIIAAVGFGIMLALGSEVRALALHMGLGSEPLTSEHLAIVRFGLGFWMPFVALVMIPAAEWVAFARTGGSRSMRAVFE